MKPLTNRYLLLFLLLLLAALQACSGGGSSGTQEEPQDAFTLGERLRQIINNNRSYLVVQADGQWFAVDPRNPAQYRKLVDESISIQWPQTAFHVIGHPNPSIKHYLQFRQHLFYIADNKAWLTDLRIGAQLQRMQISSESMLQDICIVSLSGSDSRSATAKGQAFIRLAGDNGQCFDFLSITADELGADSSLLANYRSDDSRIGIPFSADSNTPATQLLPYSIGFFDQDLHVIPQARQSAEDPFFLGALARTSAGDLLWYPGDTISAPIVLATGIDRMSSLYNGDTLFLLLLNTGFHTYRAGDSSISEVLANANVPASINNLNQFHVNNSRAYFVDGKRVAYFDLDASLQPPRDLYNSTDPQVSDIEYVQQSNNYLLLKENKVDNSLSNLISLDTRNGARKLLASIGTNAFIQPIRSSFVFIYDPDNAVSVIVSQESTFRLELGTYRYSGFVRNSFTPTLPGGPAVILSREIETGGGQFQIFWQVLEDQQSAVLLGDMEYSPSTEHPFPEFDTDHLEENLIFLSLESANPRLFLAQIDQANSLQQVMPDKLTVRLY